MLDAEDYERALNDLLDGPTNDYSHYELSEWYLSTYPLAQVHYQKIKTQLAQYKKVLEEIAQHDPRSTAHAEYFIELAQKTLESKSE